jgi:hypothetical protein
MANPVVLVVLAIIGVLLLAVVAQSVWLLFTAAFCVAKAAIFIAPVVLLVFAVRWFVQRRGYGNRPNRH